MNSPLTAAEYDDLITHTVDIITVLNESGTIQYESSSIDRVLGYDQWELVGERVFEYIHPDDRQHAVETFQDVLDASDPYTSASEELRFQHKDGSWVWLETRGSNRTASDIGGYVVTSRDITERKQYEQQLQEEQQFTQSILRSLPDALYAFDTDGYLIRWNEQFETVTGYSAEEIESMHVTEFVPDEEAAETIRPGFQTILEEGQSLTVEKILETKDGEEVPYELTGGPLEAADGSIRGATGIGRDITARKERERQLEALNHTAQELMAAETRAEAADIGVEAAREVLGLEASAIHCYEEAAEGLVPVAVTDAARELVGEPPVLTPGDSIAWRVYESGQATAISDVHADPDVYNPDTDIRSELYFPLGTHGVLIVGSATPDSFDQEIMALGKLLAGAIDAAFDKVEREQQLHRREAELSRQNEQLDQFAGIISHDLRNPLSVAQGHLELAREESDSPHLDEIAWAHDRMSALIDDLLTLARHGERIQEMEPVELEELTKNCWRNVETPAVTLAIDTDRTIQADRSRLQQLLENLMRNAVEHGGENGTVTVGDMEDGFYIEDDGPGIPENDRDKVFETGYSTAQDGTGFGLNIVNQVVEAHGWTIQVTDERTGGARFEITAVEIA